MKKILAQWPFYLPLLGILFGFFINNHIQIQATLLLVFLLLMGCFIVYQIAPNWKFAYFVFLIFAICGFIRQRQVEKQLKFDIHLAQRSKCVKFLVCQNLGKRNLWHRYECELKFALGTKTWIPFQNCMVDLYVKDNPNLLEGHYYSLDNFNFKQFEDPVLPGDFNFKSLKNARKFIGITFARNSQILLSNTKVNQWIDLRARVKYKLNKVFVEGLTAENLALVRQLIWGDKTQIDDDLKTAFQVSGTTHVLSVSGMHIALLFAFISFLIEVISLRKYKSKLVQLCIIPLLWIYAFFTGFSAPVIRAVGFFSYYLLGNVLFGRTLKLLHVLMVVGIIQLLANPLALWDIGFQLSYLAVLGLSTVLPFIKGFYENKPYLLRLVLDAFAISISSTITTYPLSLYCFHQFSVWFLLGNLMLLPMFTLLMYWLFVMVFLTTFSVPLHWVVYFLNKYLNGITWVMKLSNKLPNQFVFSYGFDAFNVLLHLLMIHLVCYLFYIKNKFKYWSIVFVLVINFLVFLVCRDFRKKAEIAGKVESPDGYFEVKKRGVKLTVITADSIPQNKLIKRLDFVIHSYSIETLNIIRARPLLKNRNITKY
jgi:competence protein ComEC